LLCFWYLTFLCIFQSVQENGTNSSDTVVSYASRIESFKSLAGESDAILLEEFINKINAGGEDSFSPIVLSPDSDKSHRKVSMSFVAYFALLDSEDMYRCS